MKTLADNKAKLNVTQRLKFVIGKVENIVGKGENYGYQPFLLFPTMFSKGYFLRVFKVGIAWKEFIRLNQFESIAAADKIKCNSGDDF